MILPLSWANESILYWKFLWEILKRFFFLDFQTFPSKLSRFGRSSHLRMSQYPFLLSYSIKSTAIDQRLALTRKRQVLDRPGINEVSFANAHQYAKSKSLSQTSYRYFNFQSVLLLLIRRILAEILGS